MLPGYTGPVGGVYSAGTPETGVFGQFNLHGDAPLIREHRYGFGFHETSDAKTMLS